YLSSAPMEPPNGQDHYSERLVLLPGLGTCYPAPCIPAPKTRAEFGLPEGRTLYFYPHAPFKIHPDNDAVLAAVLAADPDAIIVLVEGRHPVLTRDFLDRLAAAHPIASADRFRALSYLPHQD